MILQRLLSPKPAAELSFELYQILQATENLSDRYKIGKGGEGTVYRVQLPSGELYASKRIQLASGQSDDMSKNREIQTAGNIRHRNIVKILGFWKHRDCGLILYEYMHNGSLNDVLHEMRPPPALPWQSRYKIAIGIAHGLSYLHHDCCPPIIHRDIKPSNILFDSDMEPHISDFGIAHLINTSFTIDSSSIRGTLGYFAPECREATRISKKMDVYSYGVVLLELITRKNALDSGGMNIVSWVKSYVEAEDVVIDQELRNEFIMSRIKEKIVGTIKIALKCTEAEANDRPSMRQVVKMLSDIEK